MSVKSWEARKVLHLFILHLACMRWYCSIHSYFEIALFSFYFNSSLVILVLQHIFSTSAYFISVSCKGNISNFKLFKCLFMSNILFYFRLFQFTKTLKYFSFSLTITTLKQTSLIFVLQVEHYLFSTCRLDISNLFSSYFSVIVPLEYRDIGSVCKNCLFWVLFD